MTPLVHATLFRDAADVKRYHTQRTIREQTVGQHSFNMLTLLMQVAPDARKEVMTAIIHHDLPELMTGDIPAPIKRLHTELAVLLEEIEDGLAPLAYDCTNMTPQEMRLIKWCDTTELVMWSLEERSMGNKCVESVIHKGMTWLWQVRRPNAVAQELLRQLHQKGVDLGVVMPCIPPNAVLNIESEAL
jgi:hypothetical protein